MRGSARPGSDWPTGPDQPDPPDRQRPADQRPADQRALAHADLSHRLDRMPDGHPSSARYASEVPGSRRADEAAVRRPESSPESPGDRARGGGWAAPDVHGSTDRPKEDEIRMTDDRVRHTLDGDGPGEPGGGHRHGTGRPRKSEFPEGWADDRVVSVVEDVARRPDEVHWQESNTRWRVIGERDGVRITAVVLPDGRIWTAWPEPGRAGTTQQKAG